MQDRLLSRSRTRSEPEPEEEPKPKKSAKKEKGRRTESDNANRDFEPGYLTTNPNRSGAFDDEDDSMTPGERARSRPRSRAAWAKLIWISFLCFMASMMFVVAFWFHGAFQAGLDPTYVTLAGVIGLFTWITAAVGVGLCLSGPVAPGHWLYGISAATATVLHLLLLAVLVSQGNEYSIGKEAERDGASPNWGLVPTRLDAVTFYLTIIIYKDEESVSKGKMGLSIFVGVLEMVRTVLILMLLSSLARAAGDDELAHSCTRAAGFATYGPGTLAICMLLFTIALVETNAQTGSFAKILYTTLRMGTYAIFMGTLFPGLMAARYTGDACDEPFQSKLPQL